nr:MAG TPA: hypothetical protein [Caudoviricetes sp.]
MKAARRSVFPTHVGVFPSICRNRVRSHCLPHACGGVSVDFEVDRPCAVSSPRMWGCFPWSICINLDGSVFPTHVGVFL